MSKLNNCASPSFEWQGKTLKFDNIEQARQFVRDNKLEIVLGLSQVTLYELKGTSNEQRNVESLLKGIEGKILSGSAGYTMEGKPLLGTTKALTYYTSPNNGKRVLNEFNEKAYEENFKGSFIEDRIKLLGSTPTASQLTQIKKEAEFEWELNLRGMDFKRNAGTTEHLIAEAFFNSDKDFSLKEVMELSEKNNLNNPTSGSLSENACMDYLKGLNDFKAYLNETYESPIFLTEQAIAQFSPELHTMLRERKVSEGVVGFIDLLVIDKYGNVGIYDFKTSVKPREQWNKDKLQGAAMQQLIYKQILKNLGIPETKIKEVALVPIHFSNVDVNLREIKSIRFNSGNDIVYRLDTGKDLESHHLKAVLDIAPSKDATVLNVETEGLTTASLIKDLFGYEANAATKFKDLDTEFEKLLKKEDPYRPGRFIYDTSAKLEILVVDKNKPNWENTLKTKLDSILKVENEIYRLFPKRAIRFFKDWRAYNEGSTTVSPTFVTHGAITTDDQLFAAMKSYIENPDWAIVENNDSANELGLVLFYNTVSNTYHFLNITTNKIKSDLYSGEKGTTLLGKYLNDSQAIMLGLEKNATIQDLEMLKVYAFIQSNPKTFKNANIGVIKTIQTDMNGDIKNMWSQFNHELDRQWHIINKQPEAKALGFNYWKPSFDNYANSLIFYINQLTSPEINAITKGNWRFKKEINDFKTSKNQLVDLDNNLKLMEQLLTALYKAKLIKGSVLKENADELILQLSNYIANLKGLKLKNQKDWDRAGNVLSSKNTQYTASSQIGHSYAQELRNISSSILDNTRIKLTNELDNAKQSFKDLYGMDTDPRVGGFSFGTKYFEPLLDKDTNGKFNGNIISEKTPGLTAVQIKFIKDFTDRIKNLRINYYVEVDKMHPAAAEQLAEQFRYQLPVMKAGIMTLLAGGNKKDWFRKWRDYVYNPEYFQEVDDDKKAMSNAILEVRSAFAGTEPKLGDNTQRIEAIETMVAEGTIEKDLEAVFSMFAMTTVKSVELNKRKTELTIIQAMAHMNDLLMHNDIPNISEWIDGFISYSLLGKRDVEAGAKKSEITYRTASQVVSTLKMTFKPMATVTEHVQGFANITSKLISTKLAGDKTTFDVSDLQKASAFLMSETINSQAVFADLVDRLFRFATNSNYELMEKFMVGRRGAKRLSYWAYVNYSGADFNNRIVLALAQMLKDGTLVLDGTKISDKSPLQVVNRNLVYNPKLDKRFSTYLNYKNIKNPSAEWKEQKAQYEARVADMKAYNPDGLTSDGELANPYTPRELQSLRTFSNRLFGFYSDEDKMVAARFGMVRLMMQFKTWAIPKLQKWYKTSTQIDQGKYNYVKDENGEIIGAEWTYAYTEGLIQTFFQLAKESKFDIPAYIQNWKNLSPDQKENVYSALIDALIGFILASLFKVTSGALKDSEAPGFLTATSAAALKGVSDLNILDVAGSMIGSGKGGPVAVLGVASDFYTKSTTLLTDFSPKNVNSFLSQIAIYKQGADFVGVTYETFNK